MKHSRFLWILAALSLVAASPVRGAEQSVSGPAKFDVKERYGKANKYSGTFEAPEGPALIQWKNGGQLEQRSDWFQFSLNNEAVLSDDKYGYLFLAGFIDVKKQNTYEAIVKDDKPSGFYRPVLPPRFIIMTVLGVPKGTERLHGVFGINDWNELLLYRDLFYKITDPAAFELAMQAADLRLPTTRRAEAMRKLTIMKVPSAESYLVYMYSDVYCVNDVRGEAAFGLAELGDAKFIPLLMRGVMYPDERVSVPSARALSFFPEDATGPELVKMLESLDYMRKSAVIRSIINAGWKPVGTLVTLAESADPATSRMAIRLLGGMNDKRATDLLLRLLDSPGTRDVAVIISALGETKDPRALEPLLKLAADRDKRKGKEPELGEALAQFGDQRAVKPITDMIETVETRQAWDRLRQAYKKLTGKDYKI